MWLFVDDVDATFLNTDAERLKASTFFSACRNLTGSVSGLNVRASVRTDVWAVLRQYDEALDKCEQYMLDLRWSTEETGKIINNKIVSFFQRTYDHVPPTRPISKEIFLEPLSWGSRKLEAFRPIHILSAGRPRWATQLSRLAGKNAFQLERQRIGTSDIKSVMKEYGQFRLSDLYKEHRHQCPKLEVLVESFAGGPSRFATHELLARLRSLVIERFGMPILDGVDIEPRELAVAHFLYRVGFINARDDSAKEGEALHFIRFEDRPYLLKTSANLDDGLPWEVHPAYRTVLRIESGIPDAQVGNNHPLGKSKALKKLTLNKKSYSERPKKSTLEPIPVAINNTKATPDSADVVKPTKRRRRNSRRKAAGPI